VARCVNQLSLPWLSIKAGNYEFFMTNSSIAGWQSGKTAGGHGIEPWCTNVFSPELLMDGCDYIGI